MAAGRDAVTAYSIVLDLVERDRGDADSYLARRGFTPSQRASILESTHCVPPESYFIVTSDMLQKSPAWLYLGLWDMRRAYIARQARLLPRAPALADLAARFEYAEPDAARLYTEAEALASEAAIEAFIAPVAGRSSPNGKPAAEVGRLTALLPDRRIGRSRRRFAARFLL